MDQPPVRCHARGIWCPGIRQPELIQNPSVSPIFFRGGSLHMRQDIEFDAEGTTLRGWLFTPDSGNRPCPTIVMAHGFSAVKEMYLDSYAEIFAQAGLAALVFDNRNFGASEIGRAHV